MMLYKIIHGERIELTPKELATMQAEQTKYKLREATRPLTSEEVTRMVLTQQMNTLDLDDNTALRAKEFYPPWKAGLNCVLGHRYQHGGTLWRCRQAHTAQAGWEPGAAGPESLWKEVCETHAGTEDDPIPYSGNMELMAGMYYVQDYVIYKCIQATGQPVYHALADLVGLYVEVI